jgi:predicted lactoylglutathione lyase
MKTFINLPVKDLSRATGFFEDLGFHFDKQFTDENATMMVISEDAAVMLAAERFFEGFIAPAHIPDTDESREVLVGLSVDRREDVDDLVDRAVSAGGQSLGEAIADGPMYMRGFRDLDGHQWSFIHMDMSAVSEGG